MLCTADLCPHELMCLSRLDRQRGVQLTDKAKMDAANFDLVDFVDVGVECTLRQLLESGYFHADP